MRTVMAALIAVLWFGGCSDNTPSSDGEGSCPAYLDYAGHRYVGHGELKRDPATTGRTETGSEPGCDSDASEVQVAELVDIAMNRAVLVRGSLYIRTDRPFPAEARGWFIPAPCDSQGAFQLRGDWLSVQGPNEPRFDGDLRPPYRLGLHVNDGPTEYLGATIQVRATDETDPLLGPKDVKTSLWKGGGLVASVHCEDDRFVAESLASTPG